MRKTMPLKELDDVRCAPVIEATRHGRLRCERRDRLRRGAVDLTADCGGSLLSGIPQSEIFWINRLVQYGDRKLVLTRRFNIPLHCLIEKEYCFLRAISGFDDVELKSSSIEGLAI